MIIRPNFQFEIQHKNKGYSYCVGVDEVGRGCFAGPVVAAAVYIPNVDLLSEIDIRDSKMMTAQARQVSSQKLQDLVHFSIFEVSCEEINTVGIGKASDRAMSEAVHVLLSRKSIKRKEVSALIDGFLLKHLAADIFQEAIVKGDATCLSIAAASILAKVYRDKRMNELACEYDKYGWEENKGYGTKAHRENILAYGITPYHRIAFVNTYLQKLREESNSI